MKVAIQGQAASFHDLASRKFFGDDIQLHYCNSFKDVFETLRDTTVTHGVVALENSLFGSINPVYDLLLVNNYKITGEIYIKVEFCLIALPGTQLDDIHEVHSQLPALVECDEYLATTLGTALQVEENDTAGSVALIKSWNDNTKAAIASEQAAKMFGLEILARNIETHHENYTRFAVLQRETDAVHDTKANKTSLVLQTPKDTKAGSLFHALSIFEKHNINMTALHSRPIIGKAWHYMFYIDIALGTQDPIFEEAITELKSQGCDITVLGSYVNGM